MTKPSRLTVVVLVLAPGCWAQNLLTVQVKVRQKWSAEEVDKLYLSACAAVQREFGDTRSKGTPTSWPKGWWYLPLKTSCPWTRGWRLPGAW
jgi:hypothetical protein